jgi:hypothetical protein
MLFPSSMTAAPLLGLVLSAVPSIGYVQATGWAERSSTPARFQPLNLVDGNLKTGWCSSGGDAQADTLTIGFPSPVVIDEVRVATGNQADASTFHGYARAKKFVLRTEGRASTFAVADTEGVQTVKLEGPLQGTTFALEVLDVEPGEDPASPACVSELQFVSHGRPLPAPPKKLLHWNADRAGLLGTWYAGDEGAPDRSLSFFVDGTWVYRVVPPGEPSRQRTVTGQWGMDQRGLWMKAPGSARGHVQTTRELQADAHGKAHPTLKLTGGVSSELRVTFRDRR